MNKTLVEVLDYEYPEVCYGRYILESKNILSEKEIFDYALGKLNAFRESEGELGFEIDELTINYLSLDAVEVINYDERNKNE